MAKLHGRALSVLAMIMMALLLVVGCQNPLDGQDDPPSEESGSNDDTDQNGDTDDDDDDGEDPADLTLSLSPSSLGIRVGATADVTATVSGATDSAAVDWSIADGDILSIDASTDTSATFRADSEGATTITATLRDDPSVSAAADVSAYIVSVVLSDSPSALPEDDELDLSTLLSVLPESYASQEVEWTSSDAAIVSVNADGVAIGEDLGSATITATSVEDSSKSDTTTITVEPGATDVTITSGGADAGAGAGLVVNDTLQLGADVAPPDRPQTVTWSSSDDTVVTVDSEGLVDAVGLGDAVVTATSKYNGAAYDTISITVSPLVTLSGIAVDSVGGAAVDGSTVTVTNEVDPTKTYTASTDGTGSFSISDIYPGLYTLTVEQSGLATSQVQGLDLRSDVSDLELVQHEAAFGGRSTVPPTVSITGIVAGESYGGTQNISVTASGENPVVSSSVRPAILLGIGSSPTTLSHTAASGTDTLAYSWNADEWPDGEVVIEAVAYDNNNNRTALRVPVFANGANGDPPFGAPTESRVSALTAITYGESLHLFTAEPDTSSFVVAEIVQPYSYYDGVRMYRGDTDTGPWVLVDQTHVVADGNFTVSDAGTELTQGSTYYYQFAYFDEDGEGPRSSAYEVTILPPYDLVLSTPTDDAVIADATPQLSWDVTGDPMPAGASRTDYVVLSRPVDGALVLAESVNDATTYTVPSALSAGVLYEWNIDSRTILDNPGPGVSVSYPTTLQFSSYKGGSASFSSNGSFQFTVQ